LIDTAVLVLSSRLLVMAVATFLAIAVWARVRDAAWMLFVIGVIAGYADILYNILIHFGLLPADWPTLLGQPVLPFVFVNLPWLFFSAAFLLLLRRYNRR